MMNQVSIPLSGLVYPEDGWWLAHCLELDIVGEGASPREAIETLLELCALQIETAVEEGTLKAVWRPAPRELWLQFWTASKQDASQTPDRLPPLVERFDARTLACA